MKAHVRQCDPPCPSTGMTIRCMTCMLHVLPQKLSSSLFISSDQSSARPVLIALRTTMHGNCMSLLSRNKVSSSLRGASFGHSLPRRIASAAPFNKFFDLVLSRQIASRSPQRAPPAHSDLASSCSSLRRVIVYSSPFSSTTTDALSKHGQLSSSIACRT